MLEMPYFMTNEEWYYFDFDKREYALTEKAPPRAVESYKEFMREFKLIHSNGKEG